MKKYSWRYKINADAQKVGEELEEIERNGTINPENLVAYAERHKNSELYKCFEWDDTEASRKYRLQQASTIVSSISVEIKEEPKQVQKLYFVVNDKQTQERTYKNINDILQNDEEYNQIVDKAKNDFIKCKEKYEALLNKEDLKEMLFDIYRKI